LVVILLFFCVVSLKENQPDGCWSGDTTAAEAGLVCLKEIRPNGRRSGPTTGGRSCDGMYVKMQNFASPQRQSTAHVDYPLSFVDFNKHSRTQKKRSNLKRFLK
jgi:hypothetical protein